jgi:hypothetical protein
MAGHDFDAYVEKTEPYNQAIEDAGNQPWFRNPEKLGKLERYIPGISKMPEDERRKALYERHTARRSS